MAHKPAVRDTLPDAAWEDPDAYALQAMARDENGKRALTWIITECCGSYRRSFMPGDSHVTAFLEGRRDVGRQIGKLLALNLSVVKELREGRQPRKG